MNIEIKNEETSGVDRHVQVSVPVESVKDAEDRAARRYASSVRLPGFRPGKAPPQMVRKKFADAIRQEALEAIVRDAYKEVVEKQDLKVASQPHVHDLKFEEGKPLTFEIHFELRPTVDLARTSGFRVTRRNPVITDDNVRDQIESIRDQYAAWAPVDGKPLPGDMVNVEVSTGGGSGETRSYPIVIGAGQAIPGIEELIMEASPGETVERPVKWPDDFPDETQRGQTKTVRVRLQDVKRKSAPELDDAFARETGDFDSLEALRTTVRADLAEHARRDADAEVRQKLIDEIIGANPFEVPKSWVQQFARNYAEAYQIPEEDHERFSTEFRAMAERQIRRDLVIETLAEREGLAATEKDIDDRITEQAEKRGVNPGQLYAQLEKSGRLKEIERSLTEDKVFQWLLEKNEVQTES
ncbi:MAG TPA: trigger factor [Gemmatimonadaceae bacterium]|nr:trigger factor [Gemmatimonadaceae bacterium]